MRERLHEYLTGRPAGATSAELLDLVFTSQGRDPEFGTRFLTTLLGSDPRFRFDAGECRWRARVHDRSARALADVSFVVIDLETTGGSPGESGIIEMGAVRVVGGRLVDRFSMLVDPGRSIPSFVSRLTGITHEMVVGQPPIREALPRFLDFAGDGVLVAHNLAFDLGHLNGAHRSLFGRPLDASAFCTLRQSPSGRSRMVSIGFTRSVSKS